MFSASCILVVGRQGPKEGCPPLVHDCQALQPAIQPCRLNGRPCSHSLRCSAILWSFSLKCLEYWRLSFATISWSEVNYWLRNSTASIGDRIASSRPRPQIYLVWVHRRLKDGQSSHVDEQAPDAGHARGPSNQDHPYEQGPLPAKSDGRHRTALGLRCATSPPLLSRLASHPIQVDPGLSVR